MSNASRLKAPWPYTDGFLSSGYPFGDSFFVLKEEKPVNDGKRRLNYSE